VCDVAVTVYAVVVYAVTAYTVTAPPSHHRGLSTLRILISEDLSASSTAGSNSNPPSAIAC
jgi:hypothetical protein